jgi:hypothetical protein
MNFTVISYGLKPKMVVRIGVSAEILTLPV